MAQRKCVTVTEIEDIGQMLGELNVLRLINAGRNVSGPRIMMLA